MRGTLVLWAFWAAACGGPVPLEHATPSPEALAREVLAALQTRDAARLAQLALNEREFAEGVWPGLPAARAERNLPRSYVWGDLRQKSEAALRQALAAHGGTRYELKRIDLRGRATRHGGYVVHRRAVLVVRDPAGQTRELRVCGSLIEAGGAWKVFSFVVDP